MKVEQFEDKALAHYSYAILSECAAEVVVIDPGRDIGPYLEFAERNGARITGIIETHPHADFVSGHLELAAVTGAPVYCSKDVGATYVHQSFDDGDIIVLGRIRLKAINTPGHSPDSISVVLEHDGKDKYAFTGDTLFIGDCGRPDLRENAGGVNIKREELARKMYRSLREKLLSLSDETIVYPAHGAGTLCGKSLSDAGESTIGIEKATNWSLQEMTEEQFADQLLADQPFIPLYFPFNVELNRNGAMQLDEALAKVPILPAVTSIDQVVQLNPHTLIVDTRPAAEYRKRHLPNSINLMSNGKFETWLGSLVPPSMPFYLAVAEQEEIAVLLKRIAKIGYELNVAGAFALNCGTETIPEFNATEFEVNRKNYRIIDVRNASEVMANPIFSSALNIPLPELQSRLTEIPVGAPIAVHCASGFRSAAGASIIADKLPLGSVVYDMGEAIKKFGPAV